MFYGNEKRSQKTQDLSLLLFRYICVYNNNAFAIIIIICPIFFRLNPKSLKVNVFADVHVDIIVCFQSVILYTLRCRMLLNQCISMRML